MSSLGFFRWQLDQVIDLRHPLAVLSTRLPWAAIEAVIAPKIAHQARPTQRLSGGDLDGAFDGEFGGGISPADRPRLPVRLMVSLLYLKNSFNLSDEKALILQSSCTLPGGAGQHLKQDPRAQYE